MLEETCLSLNGEKIFYRKIGNGIPIVLVHGFAEDGNIWDRQVDTLKDYSQLIIPDLPGSGKSVSVHSIPYESTIDDYADCIKAILYKVLHNDRS